MKKTIVLLGFIAMAFCSANAQDTVRIRDMRLINRYFVPVWPDAFPQYTYNGNKFLVGWIRNLGESYQGYMEGILQEAWRLHTDDTLQVYGIAASLSTMWRLYPDYYASQIQSGLLDTSCEFLYEYLRLFEADPDSLRPLGDELLVHLNQTPISYYVDLDLWKRNYTQGKLPILPMYERYFSAPVTVTDTFYVGRRYRTDHLNHDKDVILPMLADSLSYGTQYEAYYYDHDTSFFGGEMFIKDGWYYSWERYQQHPFLFPIIAPPDTTVGPSDTTIVIPSDTIIIPGDTVINGGDTIVNPNDTVIIPGDTITPGGDTLAVRQPDLLYRYTNVAPNPARNSVRITSSFGISRIEAYDLRGRRIYESPQLSTFSFPLSTIDWPRGTYLLRITTPAGPTTKKLLIQ